MRWRPSSAVYVLCINIFVQDCERLVLASNFYGSAMNHLEVGIWVGWSVGGFPATFQNKESLSKQPSL